MNIVLFPGFLADSNELLNLKEELSISFLNNSLKEPKFIFIDYLNKNSECSLTTQPTDWVIKLKKYFDHINLKPSETILLGYSMGGRLALFLFKELFNQDIKLRHAFALSANPGVLMESLDERNAWINKWVRLFTSDVKLNDVIREWDAQPVFKNTTRRTKIGDNVSRDLIRAALEVYDYQRLNLRPEDLKPILSKVSLLFGEQDTKYQQIHSQLKGILGKFNSYNVANAGHRLHFDSPSNTANLILNVLKNEFNGASL